MSIQTLRSKLHFYQRMIMVANTAGDLVAHETYKQVIREIEQQIKDKEKTARSERTA